MSNWNLFPDESEPPELAKPAADRPDPVVWVRRLVIVEHREPDVTPIREIRFQRGLNIIRTAEPVRPERFAAGTGVAADLVTGLLADLEKHKTFVFRSDGVNVDWAYPVTATETPHRIRLDSGERFFAA